MVSQKKSALGQFIASMRTLFAEEQDVEKRWEGLAPLFREEIFLGTPSQILCDAGCKGLCIHCGHNLSSGPCDCALEEIDPRWSALVDLQKRMAGQEMK